ncbi:hypothetical protein BH20ACT24_BH20ACT24_07170 [soil metagenome]
MSDRGAGESRLRTIAENGEKVPFDVPKPIAEHLAALDLGEQLLAEAGEAATESPEAVEGRITLEATERLAAGDRLENIEEEVLDVRAAAERAELRVRVVREALDVLRGRASGLLDEHAGALAASMQQALDGLIGKAAKVAPGLNGAGTAEAAIRAGDGVSRAWEVHGGVRGEVPPTPRGVQRHSPSVRAAVVSSDGRAPRGVQQPA